MSDAVLAPFDEFKETEIGPIPVDWDMVLLGDLIREKRLLAQNGFPCGKHNQAGRGVPHLRPFNIDNDGQINLETIKYVETDRDLRRYLLRKGDVLFNNTNSEELVGKTAYWARPGDFVLSNHMTILRVLDSDMLDPYFLARYLHIRWLDGHLQGLCRRHVNQASISLARLKQILTPLPPLPEQRRIAHVLSTIQREIAAQDALITAAKEVKRSLMERLFTYGAGAEPAPTKETEIGKIPEHWEIRSANEIFPKITDGTHDTPKKLDRGIPLVTSKLLKKGKILLELADYFISRDDHSAIHKRSGVEDWDILYSMIGTLGEVAVVKPEYPDFSIKNVGLFKTGKNPLLAKYSAYWLQSEGAKDFISVRASGTSQRYVPLGLLRNFPIPVPPITEKIEIVAALSACDAKILAEEQRKSALQALFKSMLHQLMTGQIRLKDVEL